MTTSRIAPEIIQRNFGLTGRLGRQRVRLPLKAVQCHFAVCAGLVEVSLTQVFRQENPRALDCDYQFPLPADASVFACQADINGRVISARVLERGEAVRLAEQKKTEGRRVALVEAERENLFTLSLKNLQPEDLVVVTLKYLQPVRHLAGMPSVEIPFCPGVRYLAGNPLLRANRGQGTADDTDAVPDASRISPPRLDPEHPDAAFVEIHGRLEGRFIQPASIGSPSHEVAIRGEDGDLAVVLAGHGAVPDRDFVLRWREAGARELSARGWWQEADGADYALVELHAPQAGGAARPLDFYFLLDQSGSMAGDKWQQAVLAVQTAVAKLSEQDRVMLTLFATGHQDFAEKPVAPAELKADRNFPALADLGAGGGTNLRAALQHVVDLAARHSAGRDKALILITDAQLDDEPGILELMRATPDFPVHCFGLDLCLNDSLLLALARQQQGTFHSMNPADDVVKVVSDLALTIRHPVLTGLSLPEGWEPAAGLAGALYSGQVIHLSARASGARELALQARLPDGRTIAIPVTRQAGRGAAPRLHWCKTRLQDLVARQMNAAAVKLSVASNLICPLTAFIAWDEAEKVAVASHELTQPVLEPMTQAAGVHGMMCCYSAPEFRLTRKVAPDSSGRSAADAMADQEVLDELLDAEFLAGEAKPSTASADQPPGQPENAVDQIVRLARLRPGASEPVPCPDLAQRRRDFESYFVKASGDVEITDLVESWRQLIVWAFADRPEAALERSTQLALFLAGAAPALEDLARALAQLLAAMAVAFASHQVQPEQSRLVELLTRVRQWTSADLAVWLGQECGGPLDPGLIQAYVAACGTACQQFDQFARQTVRLQAKG